MAKKSSKERVLEQRRKEIFAKLRLYRRRVEYYVFVIPVLFIFLGYGLNAIKTNDATNIKMFLTLAYRATDEITANIIPVSAIFALFSISIASLVHPKFMQIVGTIVVMLLTAVIFFIPSEITKECLLVSRQFVIENKEPFIVVGLFIFLLVLKYKKTRKWFIHTVKYGFEIAIISAVCYFAGFYKTFNVVEFAKDYFNAFKMGVFYLQKVTDIVGIGLFVLVFAIMYSSIYRGIVFAIDRHFQAKKEVKKVSEKNLVKDLQIATEDTKVKFIMLNNEHLPKIGICVPAYNEELTAPKTLDSILECDYPADKCEIMLVADGSTDNTVDVVAKRYNMRKLSDYATRPVFEMIGHKPVKEVWQSMIHPNLKMVVKINGGKFDALNTGLQYFSRDVEYMSVIDADTTLCKHAFRLLATEAVKSKGVVALAGAILPRDEYRWYQPIKAILTNWQLFDYLASFHISRGSLSFLNAMMIVSGAFGFFDRYMVLAVKGYKESLAEDSFLTLELQGDTNSVIKYVPEAIAYTQVPTTLEIARKQRMRWFKGLTEVLGSFNALWIENPKMAVAFAEFSIVEWLTAMLAPYGLAMLIARPNLIYATTFQIMMGLAIITPMLQGFIGMCIESSYRKIRWSKLFYLPIQVFMAPLVVLWRNDGIMDFSSKAWGKMTRS